MHIQSIINTFMSSASFTGMDEVELFREFAKAIAAHSNSIFIDETHGTVANVSFQSRANIVETCEIADLLIVVKNSITKMSRATFWQAKKETDPKWQPPRGKCNFDFKGQFNQWELLSTRPTISGCGSFQPHPDLLKAATSPSIGSYGVFYSDNGSPELNFSVAEVVTSSAVSKHPRMVINERLAQYFAWNGEALVRHNIRSFLEALRDFHIGAIIDPSIKSDAWLVGYINGKCRANGLSDFIEGDNQTQIPDVPAGPNDDGDGISILLINTESDLTRR